MPNPDDDPYDYYAKAVAALNSDDFTTASTLCETAGKNFERIGSFHEASVAYDLLGLAHYRAGALEDAESANLKSLALIDRTDETSDLEYAKTCNSLAAVVNAMRDHARAMDWLSKSLHIKKELQDKPGSISTYHQMGIIEQSRSDLEEARRWYEKAISLEKSEGDIANLVGTVRCLARTMEDESDPEAVDDIYRIATDAIEKTGDVMLAKTAAEQARKDYDFRAATEFYRKAYKMAATGKPSNKASHQAEIIKRIRRLRSRRVQVASDSLAQRTEAGRSGTALNLLAGRRGDRYANPEATRSSLPVQCLSRTTDNHRVHTERRW